MEEEQQPIQTEGMSLADINLLRDETEKRITDLIQTLEDTVGEHCNLEVKTSTSCTCEGKGMMQAIMGGGGDPDKKHVHKAIWKTRIDLEIKSTEQIEYEIEAKKQQQEEGGES